MLPRCTLILLLASACQLEEYTPTVTVVGDNRVPADGQSGDGAPGDSPAGDQAPPGDPGSSLPNGSFCTSGTQCTSTVCIDSVCCAEACDGTCEECDNTGTCVASTDDDACGTVDCDGLDTTCRDYDDPTERCASRGVCKVSNTVDCTDYLDASAVTPCSDNDPGTAPDTCDGGGSCVGVPVVLADVGTFSITTGAVGTMVPVTGVGFQPKVILFWWSGRTEDPATVTTVTSRQDFRRGFGFTVGPGQSRVLTTQSENGVSTGDADRMHREDGVISSLRDNGTLDGLAELVSFDADGFTLEIVFDPFDVNLAVTYLALGGASITNAAVGTFSTEGLTVAGSQYIGGVGFQPDLLLFINGTIDQVPPATTTNANLTIGAAIGSAPEQNMVAGVVSQHGASPPRSRGYGLSGESLVAMSSGGNNPYERGKLAAFGPDGFTVDWVEIDPDYPWHYFYLAIQGGNPRLGSLVTIDDLVTPIVVTGLGYEPAGALLVTRGEDEDVPDTQTSYDQWNVGAFSHSAEQWVQGAHQWRNSTSGDPAPAPTSRVATVLSSENVYYRIDGWGSIQASMALTSVDSDGFTCLMTDEDLTRSRFIWYLTFGPSVP